MRFLIYPVEGGWGLGPDPDSAPELTDIEGSPFPSPGAARTAIKRLQRSVGVASIEVVQEKPEWADD